MGTDIVPPAGSMGVWPEGAPDHTHGVGGHLEDLEGSESNWDFVHVSLTHPVPLGSGLYMPVTVPVPDCGGAPARAPEKRRQAAALQNVPRRNEGLCVSSWRRNRSLHAEWLRSARNTIRRP